MTTSLRLATHGHLTGRDSLSLATLGYLGGVVSALQSLPGGSSDPPLRKPRSKDEVERLRRAYAEARFGLKAAETIHLPEKAIADNVISIQTSLEKEIQALEAHLDESLQVEQTWQEILREEDEVLLSLLLQDF